MRRHCALPQGCIDYASPVPYSLSNAGRGWLVHLDRLFEPDDWAQWLALPLDYRDSHHNFHEE